MHGIIIVINLPRGTIVVLLPEDQIIVITIKYCSIIGFIMTLL